MPTHYRYKNQPNGYCMSREDWVTLWLNDWPTNDAGEPFEPTITEEIDPQTQTIVRRPMTRADWEEIFDIHLRGYKDEPRPSDFELLEHDDTVQCNRPHIPEHPPRPPSAPYRTKMRVHVMSGPPRSQMPQPRKSE